MTTPSEAIDVTVDSQDAELVTEQILVTFEEADNLVVSLDGSPGPQGPQGVGILVLEIGEEVPEGTPIDTVVFRKTT